MDLLVPEMNSGGAGNAAPLRREPELFEVSLLVPRWQVTVLDSLARRHGQSVGQMLRGVISALVVQNESPRISSAN